MNALLLAAALAATPPASLPATPKVPVVDDYAGTQVTDDYRWLERWSDPKVQAWSAAQNRLTRDFLDQLPDRAAVEKRVTELMTWESPAYYGLAWSNGALFGLKAQPPKQQPLLVHFASAGALDSERVLLDPNALDPSGKTTIDFFVPSLDGKRVAVSLSKNGTESGDVHVFDVATAKEVGEVIPRVNGGTAGGGLAWNEKGTGFWYTRYPRGDERPVADREFFQQIYFHALGTPTEKDTYALGKEFPRIAESVLTTSEDGKYVLCIMANGDGGQFAYYLLGPQGGWTAVAQLDDAVIQARFGRGDGKLYLLSRKDAPRGKVLAVSLAAPHVQKAAVVIPESEVSIDFMIPTASRLFSFDEVGGVSKGRVFDAKGKLLGPLPIPENASVAGVARLDQDDLLFASQDFLHPQAWFRFSAKDSKLTKTPLVQTAAASNDDLEVVREVCTSKDGTKVPMSIVRHKGQALDGAQPAWLTGYGGFNVSSQPKFDKSRRAWLEQGGVWALANLRGGGEFGETWHQQGMLGNKQNVFDDFYACAQRLGELHYTGPRKLVIEGGSNGGLLMGAELTQHPEAFRAVASYVGYYDMLRYEQAPNGVFNVTEYGSVKDPAQFKWLSAYSPYQHVKDGAAYPAILFLTGANDPRVEPFHSRKMIARLQAANASKEPILLRTDEGGHGIGSPIKERIAQQVDVLTFFFHALGMKYRSTSNSG